MYRALRIWTDRETAWLRAHPEVPHPYDLPGLRYQMERKRPDGSKLENWQRIHTTIRRRRGDCEDLSLYLTCWLRARRNLPARVQLMKYWQGSHVWYHALVELNGRIFDPSKVLGM
jgi:hypothetical protein